MAAEERPGNHSSAQARRPRVDPGVPRLYRIRRLASLDDGLEPALDRAPHSHGDSLSHRPDRLFPVRVRRPRLDAPDLAWRGEQAVMMAAIVIALLIFLLAAETPIAFAVGVAAFFGLMLTGLGNAP